MISPSVLAFFLFSVLVGVYATLAVKFPIGYIWATYEDLFGEWCQFWCFVLTLIFSVKIVISRHRPRWFFILLALSCFYVAMEEISWGQRIFGIQSPEYFKEKNLQGELNLHNFLTGPYSTMLKDALTWVLAVGMFAFGVIYPLIMRWGSGKTGWVWRWAPSPPPFYLWPFFCLAGVMELGPFGFNEAEIAELAVGLGLCYMTVHYAFAARSDLSPSNVSDWSRPQQASLSRRLALVTVIVLNLSALTTRSIYATDVGRSKILRRIDNGVEKFAGRYKKHRAWETAIDLYGRVLKKDPGDRATRRKIAECYGELGNEEEFRRYVQEAIAIDENKLKSSPKSASTRRSLARSYRMLGQFDRADELITRALVLGINRMTNNPESASAAYSLGQTYELMDRTRNAFEQYEKAYNLKQSNKKYRKAYYRLKRRMDDGANPVGEVDRPQAED